MDRILERLVVPVDAAPVELGGDVLPALAVAVGGDVDNRLPGAAVLVGVGEQPLRHLRGQPGGVLGLGHAVTPGLGLGGSMVGSILMRTLLRQPPGMICIPIRIVPVDQRLAVGGCYLGICRCNGLPGVYPVVERDMGVGFGGLNIRGSVPSPEVVQFLLPVF